MSVYYTEYNWMGYNNSVDINRELFVFFRTRLLSLPDRDIIICEMKN